MDQAQQKALNALEAHILLAKSANAPLAASQVVVQATSAPNAYVFAELLQSPNIKALQNASPENAAYFTLLQIFSWGTWQDYESTPGLPKLSEPQQLKLRQLSLLSLATTPHLLTYHYLRDYLSLNSARALEDLVISTIYAGLLSAKLNTISQRIDVSSVAPLRDLEPGSVPQIVSILEDWDTRCVRILEELEGRVREVRQRALREKRGQDANEKAIAKLVEDKDNGKGKVAGKRSVGEDNEEMEIDENNVGTSGLRTRNAKRGGGLFGRPSRKPGGG
ncbi:uncharacterized protein KY384_001530 [Bacidia gigantensis]|uniref:uncharacterized protein n=1 Tax=Bacidia gigantensis TaxID=2732470 RepID=UPI001D03EF2F|nr:uncharacterized protein KY384_001530 [Bacidia gigantensis]KAG8533789.1 hypothetical protein KY384_001530 [Bacidia gigantensis]